MSDITCSFTGHRQIFHIHSEVLPAALDDIIMKLHSSGYNWFQSGGALGFDLLAAESVLRIRNSSSDVHLRMILPCRDQTKHWNCAERKRYNSIIGLADDVIFLQESYTQYCMHERNRMLVDTASVIVSYLMHEHGGTAYTVRYAKSKCKKIINIADLL